MSNENDLYRQRLLNVARALRESPKPEAFRMEWYGYGVDDEFPCGTPQCALGHYAARHDLQSFLALHPRSGQLVLQGTSSGSSCQEEAAHFGLKDWEYNSLFGSSGCGDAATVENAAAYIETFVSERYPLSALDVPK